MEIFADMWTNIGLGLHEAVSLSNLWYCFIGVFLGMLIGVMPGIGSLSAISLLFPLTFHLDSTSALIMLAGIYYGSAYGGGVSSILLNVPGSASSAVVCLDGYPLAKQGRAGVALLMSAVPSFVGGSVGIIIMMLFSPAIVAVAINFGSPEYFSLMVLGLIAASSVSDGPILKAIAMVVLGILFGTVGMDMYTGIPRFNFGTFELYDNINLVALAMGLFGISEVISSVRHVPVGGVHKVTLRSMLPTREDLRRAWKPTLRGTFIGAFFGALPGTGATIASYMSYAFEKKIAKDPSRFGQGAVEGICAPEAANNAADQTAFIPTMTLGIPGGAAMALIMGVLIINGISPGPRLIVEHPDMFWGLVMSFWVGNLILIFLNIPLIGLWVWVLKIPYNILYPAIVIFVCFGVYSVNNSEFDVWVALFFGVLGYVMRLLDFPLAPLLLGFVLGPLLEEHFRRAMIISHGNMMIFLQQPISCVTLLITLSIFLWAMWMTVKNMRLKKALTAID